MSRAFTLLVVFTCLQQTVLSLRYKITLSGDELQLCRNAPPEEDFNKHFDTKNLEINLIGIDEVRVGGSVKLLTSHGPGRWTAEISTLYNDRGEWIPGPFRFETLDACAEFERKDAMWYSFTKYLNKPHCPPLKDDVLEFNNGTFHLEVESKLKIPDGDYEGVYRISAVPSKKVFCFAYAISVTVM